MEIYDLNNFDKKIKVENCALGLGNFDGLHLGHKSLINNIKNIAKKNNLKSAIFLFKEHTNTIILKDKRDYFLSSFEDKLEMLEKYELDYVFVVHFDKDMSDLSPEEFISFLKSYTNVEYIIVGKDYTFGKKAEGNIKDLKLLSNKFSYKLKVVDDYLIDKTLIKSSKIRELLKDGNIKLSNEYLGRKYFIKGKVIHGEGRGTGLGFPTANLENIENYLLPKEGVYLTVTDIDNKKYKSLTSIGYNETFQDGELKIETFIIDFDSNIYNDCIKVEFLEYIRDNIKFENKDGLIKQINKDFNYAKRSKIDLHN